MSLASTIALLFALFAMLSWALGLSARALGDRLPGAVSRSPALRAALGLSPVGVSLAITLSLVVPALLAGSCHCTAHESHHPHLCLAHPGVPLAVGIAATLLSVTWIVLTAPRLASLVRDIAATRSWVARSLGGDHVMVVGARVEILSGLARRVLTVGALRPQIVADRALWARLSTDDRLAIVLHEKAHVKRRDGLTLLVLRLSTACLPSTVAESLVGAWRTASELACDRFAATTTRDPCLVAAALVACGRAQIESTTPIAQLSVGAVDADLERRVVALLASGASDGSPAPLGNDVFRACLGALAVGVAVAVALPGDAAHHTFETLLGWLL
jgi:Zn-dependent protease with chaperone function